MSDRFGRIARFFGILVATFGLAAPVAAHPHVFISTRAEILTDASGKVTAIRHIWTFDSVYSAFLTVGLDTNRDGKLSREELAELAKVNVESLEDASYFTVVKISGKTVEYGKPRDYYLEWKNDQLTLHFVLPLAQPSSFGTAFFLEVVDPTFFVSFNLEPDDAAVKLIGGPSGCKLRVQRPPKPVTAPITTLSEAFFQSLSGQVAQMALQSSAKVYVACP